MKHIYTKMLPFMTALIVIFVKELKAAIKGHAIEATSLTGMFGAKDNP